MKIGPTSEKKASTTGKFSPTFVLRTPTFEKKAPMSEKKAPMFEKKARLSEQISSRFGFRTRTLRIFARNFADASSF